MTAVHGRPAGRLERSLLGLGRAVLGASYVAVALVGALYAGPPVLLVALGSGAAGWALARSVGRLVDSVRDRADDAGPPRPGVLAVAAAAALFVPFCLGVGELGAVGAYLLLAQVGLLSIRGTLWIHRLDAGARSAGASARTPLPEDQADSCPPHELLRTLSLDDLGAEWRATGGQVHRSSAAHRTAVVRWREAVLEEMRRRDPAGFDDWLFAGAADAPEGHLRAVADDTVPRPDESTR